MRFARFCWDSMVSDSLGARPAEVARQLARGWHRRPCLIYLAAGEDLHDNAARAATEIPNARFLSLEGHSHLSASDEVDAVLSQVLGLSPSADPAP